MHFKKGQKLDFIEYSRKSKIEKLFEYSLRNYLGLFHNLNAVLQAKQDLSNVDYLREIDPSLLRKIESLDQSTIQNFGSLEYFKVDSGFLLPLVVGRSVNVEFIPTSVSSLTLLNMLLHQKSMEFLGYRTVYLVADDLNSHSLLDEIFTIDLSDN